MKKIAEHLNKQAKITTPHLTSQSIEKIYELELDRIKDMMFNEIDSKVKVANEISKKWLNGLGMLTLC